MADTQLINFRLTQDEIDQLDRVQKLVGASDRTAALRVALEVAPMGLATRLLDDIDKLVERVQGMSAELERVQRNAAAHETSAAELRRLARASAPHVVEVLPEHSFIVTAGNDQRLVARVKTADGLVVVNAQVRWEVHPRIAGRIEVDESTGSARFVAGTKPMGAILRATSGEAVSEDINVQIWAPTSIGGEALPRDSTVAPSDRPFFSPPGRPPR